jgi:ribulose-5-phosphate 4-epimerase/fuculose-1-phosphate aldolase
MKNSSEYEARLDVAAAHRLAVIHGLNEGVWNHISFCSPGKPENILISPGHTHWGQVKASTLALMSPEGEMISGERPPIKAGWIIQFTSRALMQNALYMCTRHIRRQCQLEKI